MELHAQIRNFTYKKCWHKNLAYFEIDNVNTLPSRCLVNIANKTLALSKWVSPKRTRSYPYARVYDTFDVSANKVVTIIPLIKDEGIGGDMDYLQWDTISLMSLLNVYVILSFYDQADLASRSSHKITHQKLNHAHVIEQLVKIASYHQTALHWNLDQLKNENLLCLLHSIKISYEGISHRLGVQMHPFENIEKFAQKISQSRTSFMRFSRQKAQKAQVRESLTTQPKERIGIGCKSKIIVENYLGGQYFLTIDDAILNQNILYLCESKHSKNSLLPNDDDIKDGLLKLMLYLNLEKIHGFDRFSTALRLTSDILEDTFMLPSAHLHTLIGRHRFSSSQIATLKALNMESQNNNFEIWINHGIF
ncbi:hypothetical protein ACFOPX_04415 [Helicobacter baculiformis]|uniref:Restriction endonuclease n=1 Tax=Helicobacter baculiformis TaxID=427351 RepID=A0ABV7ZKJ5_9HELI|nr:hypothetical protein [Helicobacter baculiformis]